MKEKQSSNENIRVKLQWNDHDVNIVDIDHEDNSITITREEARFVFESFEEVLVK